jgi:thioredoxin reductase (NADPH)
MADAKYFDVVILGAGPAGLQAALHAVRAKVTVLVLGRQGDSSLFKAHIENYFSLFSMTGEQMLKTGREQVEKFGVKIWDENVLSIESSDGFYTLRIENGERTKCRAVIMATGSKRNQLGIPGEKSLLGKGVSYCVDCDGHFFRGAPVCIVGDGSAAADSALTMEKIADQVHLVSQGLSISTAMQEALEQSNVTMHRASKLKRIEGTQEVTGIVFEDDTFLEVRGVFIELGAKGMLELALPLGILLDDEMRYIRTNKKQETNIPGIFAAGDITGRPWQLAKAVGEGCIAGLEAAAYAKSFK